MKKTITACILGVSLLLSGCSAAAHETNSDPIETPAPTPVESSEEKEEHPSFTAENLVLLTVRSEYPALVNLPDETILDYVDSVCVSLDAGLTLNDVFLIYLSTEPTPSDVEIEMTAFIIGAGITGICPENSSAIDHPDLPVSDGI